MVGPSHSAVAAGIGIECCGSLVEADALVTGFDEASTGIGGIERWSSTAGRISSHSSQGMMMPWGQSLPGSATHSGTTLWTIYGHP